MATKYLDTPIGVLTGFLWINKADTQYKDGGEYKAGLTLRGKPAQDLKAKVDEAVDAAFEAYCEEKGLTPKDRKQWSKYCPYKVETDDNDTPTGAIVFQFRQNASLTLKKTGEKVTIKIGMYDAAGKEMHAQIYGGSEGRIRFSMRPAPQLSNKKVGVRLDFASVQIVKLAERSGGSGSFDVVEGGYVEDELPPQGFGAVEGGTPAAGADY